MREHSVIIERNLPILVEKTDLDRIVSRLERKHVLNQETIRRILNPSHDVRQQKTNLYRAFMKRGPQSFSKLRDALHESDHGDLANLLSNMNPEKFEGISRRLSLNSVGSVDEMEEAEARTASDARMTSREVTPDPKDSKPGKLFKLTDYYSGLAPLLCRGDLSSSDLVNIRLDSNLPVKVVSATEWKKSGHAYYKMDSYPRGCALVVNNIEFSDKVTYPDRRGAENDQIRLLSLLDQLYFHVTWDTNKTRSEMIKMVKEFSEMEELNKVDCAMIVFMSHGGEGASEEDTEIIGVDGIGLKTREIVQFFNHANCQALISKPKIFIFQACRGGLLDGGVAYRPEGRTEMDGQKINSTNRPVRIRSAADIFIAYAVPPGRPANRDIFNGAWFIQTIIDVFAQNACEHDLEDMLKMVDHIIQQLNLMDCSNFQTVTTNTIGWSKRLFFNPGLRLGPGYKVDAVDDHCIDSGATDGGTRHEDDGTDCTIARCLPTTKCTLL